jgi:hypothetical protein
MRFFDTKEEVLDVQLTPYGKHLLSKGKWKPAYYEFYDDDIVYDAMYMNIQEGQEEISSRIKNTKRTKTQYTFRTPNTGSLLSQESSIEIRNTLYRNFLPLGNSSIIKDEYPSIQIKFLSGKVSGSVNSTSISGLPNNLYSLNMLNSIYTIFNDTQENVEDISNIQRIYEDGSFIAIDEDEILIDITELGIDTKIDNFEISFVEIDEQDKEIKQIYFIDEHEPTKVLNNVLIDNEDYEIYNDKVLNEKFETKNFINYFLDVKIDKEIEQSTLCKFLSKEEILRLKIVEGYDIDCIEDGDITTILSINPSTLIVEEDN